MDRLLDLIAEREAAASAAAAQLRERITELTAQLTVLEVLVMAVWLSSGMDARPDCRSPR